jgi:prepilin-type N-terminal cleavage/methylation domain-containing protein
MQSQECRGHSARSTAGFSFIELMVVVLVLGILVGIAGVPAVDNHGQALAQGELFVRDAIHTARSRALSTRIPHGVAFDTAGERLIVLAQDGTPVKDLMTKGDYMIDFGRPDMPSGLGISAADFGTTSTAAIFDAQGDPVSGGTVTLECNGQTLVLTLDAATGWIE